MIENSTIIVSNLKLLRIMKDWKMHVQILFFKSQERYKRVSLEGLKWKQN